MFGFSVLTDGFRGRSVRLLMAATLVLGVTGYLLAPRVAAVVFDSTNTPLLIPPGAPDIGGGTTLDTVDVAGVEGEITEVILTTDITHTDNGELVIALQSPSGTRISTSHPNYVPVSGLRDVFAGTTWDDTAPDSVTTYPFVDGVAAPLLRPVDPLSTFAGEDPIGTWTLSITDFFSGDDVGQLNSWSLDVRGGGDLVPISVSIIPDLVEGIEGEDLLFDVTLSRAPSGADVLIGVSISDESAVAPGDYTDADQVLTFMSSGPTAQTVTVSTNADDVDEVNERFLVTLTVNDAGDDTVNLSEDSTLWPAHAGGIIADPAAQLVISFDTARVEGNETTTWLHFEVVLLRAVETPFDVDYTTVDGTAVSGQGAGSDYVATSGTLHFNGDRFERRGLAVEVLKDFTPEEDETFTVELSLPDPTRDDIALADGTAVGTILNDDGGRLSIDDVWQAEGSGSDSTFTFTVTLDGAVAAPFDVDYTTTDGTAVSGTGDYVATSGTLTFGGTLGETQTLVVTVAADL